MNQLQTCAARVETLIGERAKISAAITAAVSALETAERDYLAALDQLGVAEAEAVISDAPADNRAAQKKTSAARDAVEFGQAKITGLRRALDANAVSIETAAVDLDAALQVDAQGRLAKHREKLVAAAGELRGLLREGETLAYAVGDGYFIQWIKTAKFPDLNSAYTDLLANNHAESPWKDHAELQKVYMEISAPRRLRKTIEGTLEELRNARSQTAANVNKPRQPAPVALILS